MQQEDDSDTRDLGNDEARARLGAGGRHYRAWVGPPGRYDVMGAAQFSLLFLLGMREHHKLLDFGCGSLRLGRLAIPYLREGCYFGIEPEPWLIEDGFQRELGADARALKRPRFDHNADFRANVFDETFDYIIAQSVFSHTGERATRAALRSLGASLSPGGLLVANWFVEEQEREPHPETSEWVYPECVTFSLERLTGLVAEAGLSMRACPWPHAGRLTWFVLAQNEADLPVAGSLDALAVRPLERP
jgi:cyclopropane fatty-acyl-phospholipid synthase-like methyltransferase